MSDKKVSVVLAVRDGGRFLEQAIESVLSEPIHELIIVDDGSTDRTFEICEGLEDARVVVRRTARLGVSHARNFGLKKARHDWIALMDADDIWVAGKTEKQLRELGGSRRAVACSRVLRFTEPGDDVPVRKDSLGDVDLFCPSNLLVHRQAFEVVGGFDESLVCTSDTDWYRRAFELGLRKVRVNEVLVKKRVHKASLSIAEGCAAHPEQAFSCGTMQCSILKVISRKVEPRMFPILKHRCHREERPGDRMEAFDFCSEDEGGKFSITNGEYGSDVNFCPVCGMKAWKAAVD